MDQFLHSKKTNKRGERILIATGAKSNDQNTREIKKNKNKTKRKTPTNKDGEKYSPAPAHHF